MPIINNENLNQFSELINISGYGIANMKNGDTVELHYHDAEEYWFVISGKAKVRTEGKEYIVQRGDIVFTKMGDEHEVIEVLEEDYIVLWMETSLRGQKRPGHLHK